jgi:hypothetical protein
MTMSKKNKLKKQVHTDSLFTTKRSKFFGSRISTDYGVYTAKNSYDYSSLCESIGSIAEGNYLYKFIFGNPLPKAYDQLGNLDEKFWIPVSSSLEQEINWSLLSIRKYKDDITLFLEYKKVYERALLLGKYEIADNYLYKIENEVCYSLWTLENRLLLLEQSGHPDEQKFFLSDFNKAAKGTYVPFLASQFSNKTERNFSVPKYNSDLSTLLSHLKGSVGNAYREYYYLKLNKFNFKSYGSYTQILGYDSYHSIIDRYITLSEVLKLAYADENLSASTKSFIGSKATYLVKKFNDNSLKTIAATYNPKNFAKIKDNDFSANVVDLYTTGKFDQAIDKLKERLLEQPEVFDYYPLYVKAFIYCKKQFECPSGKEVKITLQNSILHELFSQLTKGNSPSALSISLERYVKNISSLSIAEGLFGFCYEEFNKDSYWTRYNSLSYSVSNPIISTFFVKQSEQQKYLNCLGISVGTSDTLTYFQKRNFIADKEIYNALNTPDFVKQVDLGSHFQKSGEYTLAAEIWERLISESYFLIPIYESAVVNLFTCYSLTNQLNKAISLYVENYIINEYIVQRVQHDTLRKEIRNRRFKGVASSIDLPLFYTISEADENEVHIAYEKFLDSLSIEKPSEINFSTIEIDREKLILFLYLTCTTELFKHSTYIDGSKEGIQERITILRFLQNLDPINDERYKNEIDSLTNYLIVQEGLQQLDESKIYVNEQGLINSELKEFEGLFNRYKTIARIFNSGRPVTFYIQSREDLVVTNESKHAALAKFSDHPLKDAFNEIFEVITEKFLHSKFGISAYLSTRIRHGVLLGEVRPVFEKNHLIAQFDKNEDKYRVVDYWENKYPYYTPQLEKLQNAIALLSSKVDMVIYDLIKSNLQIRLDAENDKAWFDYYFDDIHLTLFSVNAKEITSYNEFIKKCIEFLWNRTDENLEKIRKNILGEVRSTFNTVISDFTKELQANSLNRIFPEVLTNVNTCSTEVQNSVEKVASWFNRSGSQTSDFYISKVINTVIEKLNQSHQSKILDYSINIETDFLIRGEFYSHIADLFRIFFDNALSHSLEDEPIIPVIVDIKCEADWVYILIKNKYPDLIKATSVSSQTDQHVNARKLYTEGKSGFHKATKIIKSDLKHDRNSFVKEIDTDGYFSVSLQIALDNLIYEISSH